MKIQKKWPLFLSVLVLSACGGGGGGGSSSPKNNQPPTASISGPSQMESGATISLSAIASDSDGSIASYSWTADSSTAVTLGDNKSATLSVTSANVSADTTVKLTLTVTDNQGASTQANQQVKIAAKKTSLAISGLVIDAAVPNANVTATVRDLTFTTTADANGKYTLNLSVDDAHLNDLVLITADGGSSKPTLKLVSQLPSMQTLLIQAGSDNQLDANENFSVNVTNVTTAEYALMVKRWSYYGVPFLNVSNDLQLKNLSESVGQFEKYWLAALIKIVSDMGGILPSGAKTTLDLVLDSDLTYELQTSINNATPELIGQVMESIKNDASVSPGSLGYAGTYILFNGAGDTDWVLTFNNDNKGEAKTRFGAQTFTWTQDVDKLDIHFDKPINLMQMDWPGSWFAEAIEIYIGNQYGSAIHGSMVMHKVLLDDEGKIQRSFSEFKFVQRASTTKGLNLEKEKLVGEWIQGTDGSATLFKLNDDGSVNLSNLDGTNTQTGLTWTLGNNGFTVFRDGKKLTDYYVLNDLGVGYSFVAINWSPSSPDEVFAYAWNGKLIRQQQLSVAKADLRGTYVGTDGRIYTLANDDIIEELSSRISPWNYSSTDSSWIKYIYQDNNARWLSYCDQLANKSCKVFRKTVVKVLASTNDNYHLLNTITEYDPDGEKSYSYSFLDVWSKIPSPGYFDYWFGMSTHRREFFQQTAAGVKVWHFVNDHIEINDRSDDSVPQASIPTTIAKGKLLYTRDGVAKALELVSVSDEGIVVCEYNAGASCTKGSEITLSNRTPAVISYKVSVGGSVEYDIWYASYSDPMTLFGNVATFTIVPDQGYTIESVTGCGGQLNGSTYTTAPVRDKCTITANFVKASVQ
ncbi:PKD domain-containing protein [Cellvibrio mixtus]|uniref:PKD domain-containing protein n=1 Tax=Cellvibrio mixtus TaxID=39650 RepID=UPI0005866FF1|nr:PKD domain-containing protein [Cellvibrio mixtus]